MASFIKRTHHAIPASHGVLKSEPIKVEWNFSNRMLFIKVDGIDYAQIDHVPSMADVDLKEIKDWVEYTYPVRDYKSIMYTPGRLLFSDFAKNREK